MAWLDTYPSDLLNPFKTSPEDQARLDEQAKTFPVTRLPYRGPRRHARVQFNLGFNWSRVLILEPSSL